MIYKIFLSSFFIFLITACSSNSSNQKESSSKSIETATTPTKIDMNNCICVQLWMPVCGENGKTYSNSCFAKCAGVKFKPGSCTKTITD